MMIKQEELMHDENAGELPPANQQVQGQYKAY